MTSAPLSAAQRTARATSTVVASSPVEIGRIFACGATPMIVGSPTSPRAAMMPAIAVPWPPGSSSRQPSGADCASVPVPGRSWPASLGWVAVHPAVDHGDDNPCALRDRVHLAELELLDVPLVGADRCDPPPVPGGGGDVANAGAGTSATPATAVTAGRRLTRGTQLEPLAQRRRRALRSCSDTADLLSSARPSPSRSRTAAARTDSPCYQGRYGAFHSKGQLGADVWHLIHRYTATVGPVPWSVRRLFVRTEFARGEVPFCLQTVVEPSTHRLRLHSGDR